MARLVAVVPVMHVDDLEAALEFYVSVLGFTEITATDADGSVVAHAVQTYRIV